MNFILNIVKTENQKKLLSSFKKYMQRENLKIV